MTSSKARYLEFYSQIHVPIQFQPWWLDAVCGPDAWEVALAADYCGLPVAVLPYFKTRRWGLPVIQQPPFTAYSGPWFRVDILKSLPQYKLLGMEHRAMREMIGQLPRTAFFQQCFRPEIQNGLPFYWAGFHQTTRYTYVLPDTSNLPALYAGLKNTLRTELRHAEQRMEIVEAEKPKWLFGLNRRSFVRKGLRHPYSLKIFERLFGTLAERRQAVGFLALDKKKGQPQAGLYLVFDGQEAAVLLTGFDHTYAGSGALHSLYWRAIQFCATRNLSLDFEGSMEPGIERVFRAFGATRTPYLQVRRML